MLVLVLLLLFARVEQRVDSFAIVHLGQREVELVVAAYVRRHLVMVERRCWLLAVGGGPRRARSGHLGAAIEKLVVHLRRTSSSGLLLAGLSWLALVLFCVLNGHVRIRLVAVECLLSCVVAQWRLFALLAAIDNHSIDLIARGEQH